MERRQLYFKEEFYDKLKAKAEEKGLSVSSYIRMVLLEVWRKEEDGRKVEEDTKS